MDGPEGCVGLVPLEQLNIDSQERHGKDEFTEYPRTCANGLTSSSISIGSSMTILKKEKNNSLQEITFTLYPVNRSLKNIWVVIKLTNARVTATANPSPNASVNVTVV